MGSTGQVTMMIGIIQCNGESCEEYTDTCHVTLCTLLKTIDTLITCEYDGMKTPVVKCSWRRKKPDRDSDTCNSSSDTSESELNISCSRMVQYSVPEGIPGAEEN